MEAAAWFAIGAHLVWSESTGSRTGCRQAAVLAQHPHDHLCSHAAQSMGLKAGKWKHQGTHALTNVGQRCNCQLRTP